MATRQHLLSEDDIAGLLSECETLRDRVADLLDLWQAHERTIRDLRRELAQRPAPATTLDPADAIPQ